MIEMNPYYAHRSPVGRVFDAATWSSGKVLTMAVFGLVVGVGIAVAACYLARPALFTDSPRDVLESLDQEIARLKDAYPWGSAAGIGLVGFMALVCLGGSLCCFGDYAHGNYYFRAGPGGLSVRVPNGIDWSKMGLGSKALELDVPWDGIQDCTIVQKKQLGALSRNAGNLGGYVRLKLTDGSKHTFSLDSFREPASVIDSKLRDATQMTPAHMAAEPATGRDAAAEAAVTAGVPTGPGDNTEAVETALLELVGRGGGDSAVVLSDAATGRFVQFANPGGSLLLDLPVQTLSQTEQTLATAFFGQLGEELHQYDLLDRPGGTAVATQSSFQVNVGTDVHLAARLALELFTEVYRLSPDFRLVIEQL